MAQAGHVALQWPKLVAMLAVCLVTTRGAIGVAGSGFATLAATLDGAPRTRAVIAARS